MKKISYILVSRNDSYCGDSVGRLSTTLNHTGKILEAHGVLDSSEIVLVDWASPGDPLKSVLNLNESTKKILKIVTVPPEVSVRYQKDSPFSEVHAMNVGFRRMSGEYFARIDQDTLIGHRFIHWFHKEFNVIDYGFEWPKIAFSCRRNLDQVQSTTPHDYINDLEKSLSVEICHPHNHYSKVLPSGENMLLFYGGAVGVLLCEKVLYEQHKGFNEDFIYMNNMDIEFLNRLCVDNPIYNLSLKVDADFYHLHHERFDAAAGINNQPDHEEDVGTRKTNPALIRSKILENTNSANWGLQNEDLEVYTY